MWEKWGKTHHASSDLCRTTLKDLGVLGFFNIFVLTEDVGYNKTQIEIYEIALSKMNTKYPDKIIHVGDDLRLDAHMAQKVGMTPILFDPLERYISEKIITIREFPDILKYIK